MPIFGGIREDMLRVLFQAAREVVVPAGGCFFRENDRASSIDMLQVGRVSVVKGWQGRNFVLVGLGAGDCFARWR